MNTTKNISMPETERKPEPEQELSGFRISPEPEPEFEIGREVWGGAWPAHIYIFAIIFTILIFYNLNSILGLLNSRKGSIRRKKIFVFTNILLLFFNFISALHLFINPYESHEHFHIQLPGLLFIFFGLRLPCLTAAFSLILLTLIETAKAQLYSKKLQNIWYLLGIIGTHFVVVIAVHFYLIFHPTQFQLIAICQIFYVLFGTVVSGTVIYSYLKVKQQLIHEPEQKSLFNFKKFKFRIGKRGQSKENGIKLDDRDVNIESRASHLMQARSPFVDRSLSRLFKVSIIISISGLIYVIAILYALITMLSNSNVVLTPWPWLIYQTLARLAEIGMIVGMSYLARRNILPCCNANENHKEPATVSLSC